jgi:hypothetical protein
MKPLATLFIAVALGLSIESSAYAQDAQVFPGIGCKPLNAAADTVRTTEFYIVNDTNAPVPIVCPIVWGGFRPTEVMVAVIGRVRAQDSLTCTAFGASLVASSTTARTTVFDRASQTQRNSTPTSSFPDLPLDLRIQVPNNITEIPVFSLTCELPRGGRLYSYIVTLFR